MTKSDSLDLATYEIAFILADIIEAKATNFRQANWGDLGNTADAVRRSIKSDNIDLSDPSVISDIYKAGYDKRTIYIVDVTYSGGGDAPDPFRYVYFVVNGSYVGSAGQVLS